MNSHPIATILGGGGFIGRYLVRNLTKNNYPSYKSVTNPKNENMDIFFVERLWINNKGKIFNLYTSLLYLPLFRAFRRGKYITLYGLEMAGRQSLKCKKSPFTK